MIEKFQSWQRKDLLLNAISASFLGWVLFAGFSRVQREQRIIELNYKCQHCGKKFTADALAPHHRLPEQMGGNNSMNNMYIVCPDCHRFVDNKIIFRGKLPDGIPFNEIGEIYPEIIGNMKKYQKAGKRFVKKKNFFIRDKNRDPFS